MKHFALSITATLATAFIGIPSINATAPVTLVDPIPDVPKALPVESVPMGNINDFPE